MMDYWMGLLEQIGWQDSDLHRMTWPERSALDPATCRSLLGDMFILDTDRGQCNFRLAGTRFCEMFNRELKAESFIELFANSDQQSAENWVGQLAYDNYSALICAEGITNSGEVLPIEILLLPLNHRGTRGRRVLGLATPLENPYWLGAKPVQSINIRTVRVLRPWEDKMFKQRAHASLPEHGPAVNALPRKNASFSELTRAAAKFDAPAIALQDAKPHPRAAHLRVLEGGRNENTLH